MTQELERTPPDINADPPLAQVLIVDDETITCTLCATVLSQAGYAVTATTNASEALEVLRAGAQIDLLLADIQMPGINGLQLAQVAREIDPAMAVIIMTGHTNTGTLHATARSGVADFLSKPFELDELRFAVDQALHKRELQQEQIRLRAYERLLESSAAINSILDHDELCRVIVQRARRHIPCDAGFLVLTGADPAAPHVSGEPNDAQLLSAGLALVQAAIAAGAHTVQSAAPLAETAAGPANNGMAVALQAQGRPIGALVLCSVHSALISAAHTDILALLAHQAGTALQNARLYSELQRGYHSLAELDRLKSEFIAIASHELRSPLAIVLGYTKMVRDQLAGEHREYAQRVLDSAQQIRSIVEKMVDLRDYDRDRADLILEEYRLDELVREAVERLTPAAELKGQRVTLQAPPETVVVQTDREKLLLMVGNLLDNAIKFGADHSRIRVEVARWANDQVLAATAAAVTNPSLRRLARPQPDVWAIVSVADEGPGIAREEHAQIFERFYQVADSLTRKHGGTGLGLALVNDLARLHDGLVWVESAPEQGSTFVIALPTAPAEG
jgi:signal transduction histidine kinase